MSAASGAAPPLADEDAARAIVRKTLDPDRFQTLETFVECVVTWGGVSNLVSAADRQRLWARHVLDSLQLVPLAAEAGPRWLDLGAGAGFPGLVVALARSDTRVTLVESNRKKAAFLLRAIAATGAPATVAASRAETLAPNPANVVSARAVAPLPRLLDLAAPFFDAATLGLFPKGREASAEIDAAAQVFSFDLERVGSRTDPGGEILAVRNLRRR